MRVFGIRLYFLAYALDVYVCGAGVAVEISIPELLHYLLSAVDPSGVGCKKTQNPELSSCEIDLFSTDPDLTARNINHEVAKLVLDVRRLGIHAATTEVSPHAADYFRGAGRLGNVVVGSHFQAHDDVSLAFACREHNYRHVATPSELLAQGDTVDVREHYVQYDQIKRADVTEAL